MSFKNLWFKLHTIGMYFLPFLWIFFPEIIWFYLLIILSWKINNNKCLITQLEYYLFEETFLGKKNKFVVPIHHRFILYINTFCLCFRLLVN